MALQEPVPGQSLTATWGRDVVREIRRLRPTPGPGMRLSYGPNGTTFTPVTTSGKSQAAPTNTTEILPFRLGVGTEMVTSGSTPTKKYHKVIIHPEVAIDGVGYSVANIAVDSDMKLIGLPLPKEGSGLPWVWMKDAALTDITDEAVSRTTTNTFLHFDHTNHVCVLANTEAITATEYEDEDGDMHPFHSDEWISVGRFDLPVDEQGRYDAGKKPQVLGQYVIGALVWKRGEDTPFPFQLRAVEAPKENGGTETKFIIFLPIVSFDGVVAVIDNATFGPNTSDWYEVSVPEEISETASVTAYIDRESGGHIKVSTAETAPLGYNDGQVDVGEFVKREDAWVVSYQYQIGVYRENQAEPFECRIIDGVWCIYLPYGSVQVYANLTGGGAVILPRLNRVSGTDWYALWSAPTAGSTLYCELWTSGVFDIVTSYRKVAKQPVARVGTFASQGGSIVYKKVVHSAITFSEYEEGGGGGGGGTPVTIETDSENPASNGFITWKSGIGPTGPIVLEKHENIHAAGVVLSDEDQTDVDTYLKGGKDYGTNINTENFDEECLAPTGETGEPFVGESSLAARKDHKHLITDDVMALKTMVPEGEEEREEDYPVFGTADNYIAFMRWLGVMTRGGGATGETGEVPDDEQTVTFGDITEGVAVTMGATGIGTDTDTTSIVPAPQDNMLDEGDLAQAGVWQGEWNRDTDTEGKGCSFYICCGEKTVNELPYRIYRKITIDKYGMMRSVSKAKFAIYDNMLG